MRTRRSLRRAVPWLAAALVLALTACAGRPLFTDHPVPPVPSRHTALFAVPGEPLRPELGPTKRRGTYTVRSVTFASVLDAPGVGPVEAFYYLPNEGRRFPLALILPITRGDFLGFGLQDVEVRPEHAHTDLGDGASKSFVDPHAERCREERHHARHVLERGPQPGLHRLGALALRRGRERDEHVAQRMRHRVLGLFRPARSPRHERDTVRPGEHILDLRVHPVHFAEGRLRRQHRLHEERPLIELRHELRAHRIETDERGNRDPERQGPHQSGVTERPVERRNVQALDRPDHHDVRISPRRLQKPRAERRHERQRQHQRCAHGRHDRQRKRTIQPALDSRHQQERKKDRHDDERGERNGPAHLDGSREHNALEVTLSSRQPVVDVLGHDDRGVHEDAHRNGETSKGHRVDACPEPSHRNSGEHDRQR